MKRVPTFEQFLNEKAYRMTGIYAAKGLVGKVMQAFKQEIAKVKYEGDIEGTLEQVNKAWAKFRKDGEKIIMDQIEKGTGGIKETVLFVTANFDEEWKADEINHLNTPDGSGDLYIAYGESSDFVINVGFFDDFNGKKAVRKIDKTGYMNSPLASAKDIIYGDFDASVGNNNLEIRDAEFISIDEK